MDDCAEVQNQCDWKRPHGKESQDKDDEVCHIIRAGILFPDTGHQVKNHVLEVQQRQCDYDSRQQQHRNCRCDEPMQFRSDNQITKQERDSPCGNNAEKLRIDRLCRFQIDKSLDRYGVEQSG